MVDYQPGTGYRFEANDRYFRGPPTVASLVVPVIKESAETVKAFAEDRVDAIPVSLPADAAASGANLATRVLRGLGPMRL